MTEFIKPTKYYNKRTPVILDVYRDNYIELDGIYNKDKTKIIELNILYRGVTKQYLYTVKLSDTKTMLTNWGITREVIIPNWDTQIEKSILIKTVNRYSKKLHEELYYSLNDQKIHDLIALVTDPKEFNY